MPFIKIFIVILLSITALFSQVLYQRPAFILASANLKFVFPQMIQSFYAKYPDARVYIQYGSSGSLSKTILEGKKYDIFFSANRKYAREIYKEHKSVTQPKNYAQGILILFAAKHHEIKDKGFAVLNLPSIRHITIANKATAPYGAAALQAIKNAKCSPEVRKKIRYSSDVATAIDNVIWQGDAGFLSKSALNMIPDDEKIKGQDWIEVDQKLYTPIMQAYVVSKHGLKNKNAIAFLQFTQSQEGQKIFRENGYKNIIK